MNRGKNNLNFKFIFKRNKIIIKYICMKVKKKKEYLFFDVL